MTSLPESHQLKYEAVRLETFSRWPHSAAVEPESLAKAGFYYIGPCDRVRCVFCNGVLKSWRPHDVPKQEHRTHFPHCRFVQGHSVGNVPLQPSIQLSQIQTPEPLSSLRLPRHMEFEDESVRRKTFARMSATVVQDRDQLANAGFYYTGHGDRVKCFYCGGTLRNWEASDDPWIEHARWFPRCPFIREQKGVQFVQEIQASFVHPHNSETGLISPQRESPPLETREIIVNRGRTEHSGSSNQPIPSESIQGTTNTSQGPASDRIFCKICMENEVEVTFLPCGHLVCCDSCSKLVSECPVCRSYIRGTVRTYLA